MIFWAIEDEKGKLVSIWTDSRPLLYKTRKDAVQCIQDDHLKGKPVMVRIVREGGDMMTFTGYGSPVPQGRPRFFRRGNHV